MPLGGGIASGGLWNGFLSPLPYFVHAPSLKLAVRRRSGRSENSSSGERSTSTGCFAGCRSSRSRWSGQLRCGLGLGLGLNGMRHTIWPASVGTIRNTS
jgi:hypothetical protein